MLSPTPKRASPRCARLLCAVAALVLMLIPLPASAEGPLATAQARAERLRAKLDELQAVSARAVGEYEAIHQELEQAVADVLGAESALAELQAGNDSLRGDANARVRAIYKTGGRAAMYASVLRAGSPHAALARVENINAIVTIDSANVENANKSEVRAKAAVAKLEKASIVRQRLEARADAKTAEVERLMAEQQLLIDSADAEVQVLLERRRLREEAERLVAIEAETRRLASIGASVSVGDLGTAYQPAAGTYACPAGAGVNFVNSWHAPRSGGRQHQGTDIFAPYGSAAYAVTDGVVDKWGNGGLGGITLWIRAANGDRFYYAHNAENLVPVGTVVRAGDVVALVGKTGNAAGTPPHIHFEAHPGGAGAANPYPFLAAICGLR